MSAEKIALYEELMNLRYEMSIVNPEMRQKIQEKIKELYKKIDSLE